MTKYLFSCDPGKMTGTALFDITEEPTLLWAEEWGEDEFYGKLENVFKYYSLAEDAELEVVCENFIITVQTAKLGAGPWSLKYIGAISYLGAIHDVKVTLQQPAQKEFAPNDKLRALGLWHKGGGGHALDALRHAVIYLVMNHRWRPDNLLT